MNRLKLLPATGSLKRHEYINRICDKKIPRMLELCHADDINLTHNCDAILSW